MPSGDDGSSSGPDVHGRRAWSFGNLAEDYERHRSGYPDEAVDWLLSPSAEVVADVGAGTGKLTGSLLARGLRVIAIEPDPAMLGVLQRVHPAAETRLAPADALPLPDASIDAVLVAQAWHWFPHERAAAEACRVLRPGGSLGLIWNMASPEEPWQLEVERLNDSARGRVGEMPRERPDVLEVEGLPSGELESALFSWVEPLTAEQQRARMATYSHVALLPEPQREELLDRVAAVVADEAARLGSVVVPFRRTTLCVRWCPAR
jgi:ubiquinone/menaquinone biosynthesis C-methylase UbiE